MAVVLVHGGAGNTSLETNAPALRDAARRGREAFARGAAEAAVEAVAALEDCPETNAGTGSALNLEGRVQMDAAVMVPGDVGAVAAIEDVRNPVRVAYQVLRETGHKLLAGEGAAAFARRMGHPPYDPILPRQREKWERAVRELREGSLRFEDIVRGPMGELLRRFVREGDGDTVGAVVLSPAGELAVATSTGGLFLKLPGRVGDSPIPGAGLFCDERVAVAATGQGEAFLSLLACRAAAERFEGGMPLAEALAATLRELAERKGARGGFVAVSREGAVAACHNHTSLPVCALREGEVLPPDYCRALPPPPGRP